MSRALESALDGLHGLLAETLADALRSHRLATEAWDRDPRPAFAPKGSEVPTKGSRPEPSPQLLGQVIKFLKDNGIDAPAKRSNVLNTLVDQLDALDLDDEALRPN